MSEDLYFDNKTVWVISPPKKYSTFFTALQNLLPEDTVFYLEGTSICETVRSFLQTVQIESAISIAAGTLWPKPEIYHVPVTSQVINKMMDFFENFAPHELFDHFHVYAKNKILLQGYDVFCTEPLLLSGTFLEEQIKIFCKTAGCDYKLLVGSS